MKLGERNRSPGITDPFFFHGGIHPGKVRPGFGAALIPFGAAFIGFGGKEVPVTNYEVLTSPVIRSGP